MAEARALWVVRHSIATQVGVDRLVELAARYGYGDLIVQVRARGDAFYASSLEPQAELLKSPKFDPLAYVLSKAHAAGLKVHAWLNALFTWSGPKRPLSPEHILNAHRDWLMVHETGRPMVSGDYEGLYVCPSRPEVQAHLWRVYTDVVQRYAVDGVHLDYIRYPGPEFCYCPVCQKAFTLSLIGKGDASQAEVMVEGAQGRWGLDWPDEPEYGQAWADYRRRQVTDLLAAVSRGIKRARPGVVVSAAVYPGVAEAHKHKLQDWRTWLRRGLVDVLCPMAYTKETGLFEAQIRDVMEEARGAAIWAGIGAWQIPPDSAAEKVKAARQLGAGGFALFSYGGITGDVADETYFRALQARLSSDAN